MVREYLEFMCVCGLMPQDDRAVGSHTNAQCTTDTHRNITHLKTTRVRERAHGTCMLRLKVPRSFPPRALQHTHTQTDANLWQPCANDSRHRRRGIDACAMRCGLQNKKTRANAPRSVQRSTFKCARSAAPIVFVCLCVDVFVCVYGSLDGVVFSHKPLRLLRCRFCSCEPCTYKQMHMRVYICVCVFVCRAFGRVILACHHREDEHGHELFSEAKEHTSSREDLV